MQALGRPADALLALVEGAPNELLKLVHYPVADTTRHQGVGPHKDSNILNLLLQDQVGSLQVRSAGQ